MNTIYLGFGYLCAHFVAYLLCSRHLPSLRTERGILLFHVVSFFVVVAASLAAGGIIQGDRLAVILALAAAHGIYSISFLELWSLAEGSYSFQILNAIRKVPGRSAQSLIAELSQVGDLKKDQRQRSLHRLKLVHSVGGELRLTNRGRRAAALMRALRWMANLRETG